MMGYVVKSYIINDEWSWGSFSRIPVTNPIVVSRVPEFGVHLVYMALSIKDPNTGITISNRILYKGDGGGNPIPEQAIFTYRRCRFGDPNSTVIPERVTIHSGLFDVPEDLKREIETLISKY
jgi:hypothetical protein